MELVEWLFAVYELEDDRGMELPWHADLVGALAYKYIEWTDKTIHQFRALERVVEYAAVEVVELSSTLLIGSMGPVYNMADQTLDTASSPAVKSMNTEIAGPSSPPSCKTLTHEDSCMYCGQSWKHCKFSHHLD
jgi:hypothetical protein